MNYHNITKDDMLNGDGLRVVLWVAGCNHKCPNCQNPQTHDPKGGIRYTIDTWCEIEDQLDKDYISGITFSGGDPLFPGNREQVTNIAKSIRNLYPSKDIWLYTGYLYNQVKDLEIMKYLDVLIDGPFIEELADVNFPWRGSTNQKLYRLKNGEIIDES